MVLINQVKITFTHSKMFYFIITDAIPFFGKIFGVLAMTFSLSPRGFLTCRVNTKYPEYLNSEKH